MWYNWMMKKNGKKFKMTLVKGGGNSFGGALRNSGNKIDVGVDEVLFKVGDEEDSVSERRSMDNKELHKVLLKMRNRVKRFGDLMRECFSRDREDNVPEGWLSKGEIASFEVEMKNLVDEALKVERKSRNG